MSKNDVPIFVLTLLESYTARNLFSLLRSEVPRANLLFGPKSISLREMNRSGSTLIEFNINVNEVQYSYNAYDENGDLLPLVSVGFNTAEMMKATKPIKKKDGLTIFMLNGDSNIYIQPLSAATKGANQNCVKMVLCEEIDLIHFSPPKYNRSRDDPTVKVLAPAFSSMCTQANTAKCIYLEAIGYPHGLAFRHISPQKQVIGIDRYGNCSQCQSNDIADNVNEVLESLNLAERDSDPANTGRLRLVVQDQEEANIIRIPISTVKSLSKLNNIAAPGTMIRMYYEEKKPLLISTTVGIYATLDIYLRNVPKQ